LADRSPLTHVASGFPPLLLSVLEYDRGFLAALALPIASEIRSWQLVLIASGIVAIPVAVLSFTFPEPTRRASIEERKADNVAHALRFTARNAVVFGPFFVVNGATIILLTGFSAWMPTLLGRVWGVPRPKIKLTVGVLTIILQPTRQFVAGLLMDRLDGANNASRVFAIGALVSALVFAPTTFTPFAPSLG
jgi:hypothetical protein